MNVSIIRRTLGACVALSCAALVAVGCGGGAKSGAGKSATSSDGLSYIPKTALMYMVFDTDFEGKGWTKVDDLASNFEGWDAAREKLIDEVNSGKDEVTYKDDIKPWLGDSAGVGVMSSSGKDADVVVFVASKDDAKARKSLSGDSKKAGSIDGWDVWEHTTKKEDTMFYSVKDGMVLLASSKAMLKKSINAKDDGSIKDDDSAQEAAKELGDGAVFAMVMGRSGVNEMVKEMKKDNKGADVVSSSKYLKAFNGLAIGMTPEDGGMHAHGWIGFDKDKMGDAKIFSGEFEPKLFGKLSDKTAMAYTNQDMGGTLESVVDMVTEKDSAMAKQLSQAEAGLGFTVKDLAEAFNGQYAIAVSAPSDPTVGPVAAELVVEANGTKTGEITDKLMAFTQLLTQAPPKDVTIGTAKAKQADLGGTKIIAANLEDATIVTNDPGMVEGYGTGDTLADSDAYKKVAKAADLPSKVGALLYVDPKAVATYAESMVASRMAGDTASTMESGDHSMGDGEMMGGDATTKPASMSGDTESMMGDSGSETMQSSTAMAMKSLEHMGPWLIWSSVDGSNLTIDAYMTIEK